MDGALAAYICIFLNENSSQKETDLYRRLLNEITDLAMDVMRRNLSLEPFFDLFLNAIQRKEYYSAQFLCSQLLDR
jgi:hypothetical protein